jgi:hypothetical protein
MLPGEQILLTFADGSQENIRIGATGSYYINNGTIIESIVIPSRYQEVHYMRESEFENDLYYRRTDNGFFIPAKSLTQELDMLVPHFRKINNTLQGLVTYSFFTSQENTFGIINDVKMDDCSILQFIGE